MVKTNQKFQNEKQQTAMTEPTNGRMVSPPVSVFVTSAYSDKEPISSFVQAVKQHPATRHRLTEDPVVADVILFVENSRYHEDRYFKQLLNHPLVNQYRHKVFMYNPHDTPWLVLPGFYPCISKSIQDSRVIAGSPYIETVNPYVKCNFDHQPNFLFSVSGTPYRGVRSRVAKLQHPRAYINAFAAMMYGEGRKVDTQMQYAELLVDSKYVLCPKGIGPSSLRLFEVMNAGRVPVIISDKWVPPKGINWSEVAVFVAEKDVEQIPQILEADEPQWEKKAKAARLAWEQHFAPAVVFDYMVDQLSELENLRAYKMPLLLKISHQKAKVDFWFRFLRNRTKAVLKKAVKR